MVFCHGWLAPLLEHRPVAFAGFGVVGEVALVQRAFVAGRVAQRFVELELQDMRQEITGIRRIARHMVFGAGIEEFLTARADRGYALVFGFQFPPGFVVVVRA